jgi:hypothetical protein
VNKLKSTVLVESELQETGSNRKSKGCPVKLSFGKATSKFWTGLNDPSSAQTTYTLKPAPLFPARPSPFIPPVSIRSLKFREYR